MHLKLLKIFVLVLLVAQAALAQQSAGMAIVKLQTQRWAEGLALLEQFAQHYPGARYTQQFPKAEDPEGRVDVYGRPLVDLRPIYRLEFNGDTPVKQVLNLFSGHPAVVYAEPLYDHEMLYTPTDPLAGNQQAPYLSQISAYQAWDIQKGNPNLVIAIVDAGLSGTHVEFANRIYTNQNDPINNIDDDNNGYIDDFRGWNFSENNNNPEPTNNGHGNAVAALAIAQSNNGEFGTGVAINGQLLPVKVFGQRSAGYEGLYYAAMRGAHVINLSWGRNTGLPSQYEQDVVNFAAINKDAIVTVAAGNIAQEVDYFPAIYDNVISVGHVTPNDVREVTGTYNYSIDLMAPGSGLYGMKRDYPNISYGNMDPGSSYASPIVGAAAMLVKSQYPSLNAAQIAEILRVNTDKIDNIPANAPYAGKLGTGRLNIYKALQRQVNYSVRAVNPIFTGSRGAYLRGIDTISLKATFRNYLSSISGLRISVVPVTSNVQVISGQLNAPTVPGGASFDNYSQPFTLRTVGNPAMNERAVIKLVYSNNAGYNDEQYLVFNINNNYLTLTTSSIAASVTNMGAIGYADLENRMGIGFQRRGRQLLTEAGLLIGVNPQQVSNAVTDTLARDRHFLVREGLKYVQGLPGETRVTSAYNDSGAFQPLNLYVRQTSSVFQEAAAAQGMVLQYEITNRSNRTYDSLLVGIFADWDIGIPTANRARWDTVNKMGYVQNLTSTPIYGATAVLGSARASYFAIDILGTFAGNINVLNGFSLAEKFQALVGGRHLAGAAAEGNNVATVTGTRIYNLAPGQRRKVAFVMAADSGLSRLQVSVASLRSKFRSQNTGAVPQIAAVQACRNQNVMLAPSNGANFRFYSDAGLTRMLHEGRFYNLPPISATRTVYVTNVDSLFESASTPVTVSLVGPTASYNANPPSLNLASGGNTVTFNAGTSNANYWMWTINGQTYNVVSPQVTFTDTGHYPVQLVVSGNGCFDTIRGTYVVARITSAKPLASQDLKVYPNPSSGKIGITGSAAISSLQLTDLQGKLLDERALLGTDYELPASLPNGLYLLRLQAADGSQGVHRLTLQRP